MDLAERCVVVEFVDQESPNDIDVVVTDSGQVLFRGQEERLFEPLRDPRYSLAVVAPRTDCDRNRNHPTVKTGPKTRQ